MRCEVCGCEHDGSYGSGRFCSYKCVQKYVHYSRTDFSSKIGIRTVCPVCGMEFRSRLEFEKHRKETRHYKPSNRNARGNWLCRHCGEVFATRKELYAHKRNHNADRMYVCRFCGEVFQTTFGIAAHTSNCKMNPNYEKIKAVRSMTGKKLKGFKHGEEFREKCSEAKKRYYSLHPDELPFVKWHSSKESYAERYFSKLFALEKVHGIKREFRVGRYSLDFAFEDEMIDFEVDGSQHYDCQKIVKHDKERTEFLNNLGWRIIRIRWSEWQKMGKEEKGKWLHNNLYRNLNQFSIGGVAERHEASPL